MKQKHDWRCNLCGIEGQIITPISDAPRDDYAAQQDRYLAQSTRLAEIHTLSSPECPAPRHALMLVRSHPLQRGSMTTRIFRAPEPEPDDAREGEGEGLEESLCYPVSPTCPMCRRKMDKDDAKGFAQTGGLCYDCDKQLRKVAST